MKKKKKKEKEKGREEKQCEGKGANQQQKENSSFIIRKSNGTQPPFLENEWGESKSPR